MAWVPMYPKGRNQEVKLVWNRQSHFLPINLKLLLNHFIRQNSYVQLQPLQHFCFGHTRDWSSINRHFYQLSIWSNSLFVPRVVNIFSFLEYWLDHMEFAFTQTNFWYGKTVAIMHFASHNLPNSFKPSG